MGDSLENQDVSLDAQNAVIVDYGAFANYLRKAAALCDALEEKNDQDCIRKFLSDPQVPALYVQRSSTKDDEPDQPPSVSYFISNYVNFSTSRMAALAWNWKRFDQLFKQFLLIKK